MSLWDRILDTIIDPNIITLLLSLGVLALTVELFNPGLIFPAAFGVIALIIGFFGLQVLPFCWAGILLMLVAFGFFIAEASSRATVRSRSPEPSAFIFGALMLFDPAGDAYQVSLPVAIAIAATFALLIGFALAKALAGPPRQAQDRAGGARRRDGDGSRDCSTPRGSCSSTARSGRRGLLDRRDGSRPERLVKVEHDRRRARARGRAAGERAVAL